MSKNPPEPEAVTRHRYMSSETARRISILPRTRPTNVTHSGFDLVKTICIECYSSIVECIPKGDGRLLRTRCHDCVASHFRNVKVINK